MFLKGLVKIMLPIFFLFKFLKYSLNKKVKMEIQQYNYNHDP